MQSIALLLGERISLLWKLAGLSIQSFNIKIFKREFWELTLGSLLIVVLSGLFVGAIMGLQMNLVLSRYEASSVLGGLATSISLRNIGPLLIAFLLAGKIGALITAELANMKVSEQLESLDSLNVDLYFHLYTPRFIAIVTGSFILLVIGMIITLFGCMLVSLALGAQNELSFFESVIKYLSPKSVLISIVKSLVFSCFIAVISILNGLKASGGASGVGVAVTRCATENMVMITIMNFVISFIFKILS